MNKFFLPDRVSVNFLFDRLEKNKKMDQRRRKNREFIRAELLNEAARIWGFEDTDLAQESFDPLVGLLLGSFATGLEQAYQELDNTQSRLVQQLVRLLTPDVYTGPKPAHAVMKTQLVDPTFLLTPAHSFTCQALGSEFSFTPTGNYPLHNVQIKKAIVQDKLKDYTGAVKESPLPQSVSTHDYWLGLLVDDSLDSFEELSVFIDWRNTPDRAAYLTQVSDVRVFGRGIELATAPGLPDQPPGSAESRISRLATAINREYDRHFIRISNRDAATGAAVSLTHLTQKYPDELAPLAAQPGSSSLLNTDLLWLKLFFPTSLPDEAVYSAVVEVNAFPVANQKLLVINPTVRRFFNVFPLPAKDGDQFLDIIQVESPRGLSLPSAQSLTRSDPYWYLVRQGGIARFDERDGYAMVRNLTNLLRDELAMFDSLGRTDLETEMNNIREGIGRLYEQLNKSAPNGLPELPYLTVRILEDKGQLTVSYLTTKAEQANKIPLGTLMKRSNLAFVDGASLLLTTSIGGEKALLPDEQLPVFRKAILSRDRIVSNQDVKNFCFAQLGNRIKRVDIKKGVQLGNSRAEGLIRTLDVCLVPNPTSPVPASLWEELTHRLERELAGNSNELIRYRVVLTA